MSYIMTYHKRLQLLNLVDSVYLEMTWEPSDASFFTFQDKETYKKGFKKFEGQTYFSNGSLKDPFKVKFLL